MFVLLKDEQITFPVNMKFVLLVLLSFEFSESLESTFEHEKY